MKCLLTPRVSALLKSGKPFFPLYQKDDVDAVDWCTQLQYIYLCFYLILPVMFILLLMSESLLPADVYVYWFI
jgi:hypothetical protein